VLAVHHRQDHVQVDGRTLSREHDDEDVFHPHAGAEPVHQKLDCRGTGSLRQPDQRQIGPENDHVPTLDREVTRDSSEPS
jgi:hypothetical protein